MGMTVADLVAKLGLDTGEFDRGMDGVAAKAGRSEKVLNGVSKAAMAGAVAAGALVVKSLDTYNNFGTAINTLTRLTGMSSQAASKLTGQWQRFGVESQSGINATKFLARNLDTAQQAALKTKAEIDGLDKGSKTYGDSLSKLQVKLIGNQGAFARLGVSIFDAHGKLRAVDDVLPKVRDKLSQMDDAGQRTAMTLKLFGRGGADMLGWLTKTPAEIAKVNKELAGLGMVWGGKQVKDWKALKDAQREMGLQWTALQLNLAQTLLPAMKTLMGYVQTGVEDWNNLSDGAQGFILKATGVVGVLGMIAPKAIAAGAAIKTMLAANAASGAASAAGSAGGGIASGVAANVASAAGVGGASKGYSAMTAAKMMGGKGVTPAAYVAGTIGAGGAATIIGTAGFAAIAVAIAAAVVTGVKAGQKEAAGGGSTLDTIAAALKGPGDWFSRVAGNTDAQGRVIGPAQNATKDLVQKLRLQLDGASYGEFRKLYGTIESIKKLADKGIVLNTKDLGKQTTGDLRNLRSTIMSSLHLTAKQAETVLDTMAGHKLDFNWHQQTGKELNKTKATVTSAGGAIVKNLASSGQRAGSGLAKGLGAGQGPTRSAAQGLSSAARPQFPNLYSGGLSIGAGLAAGILASVYQVHIAGLQLASAAATALHQGIKNPPYPSALTRKIGQSIAQGLVVGMQDGHSNVSAGARRLALAGIPSITGGASPRGAANSSGGGSTVIHEHYHIHPPGGTAVIGSAEDVARQLAPHIGRKHDIAAARRARGRA